MSEGNFKYSTKGYVMHDGNLDALRRHENRVDRIESIGIAFDMDTEHSLKLIDIEIEKIKSIVRSYENEFGLDFGETARQSIDEILGGL